MPVMDASVFIVVLILVAIGATMAWGFDWIARHGGVETLSEVAEELHNAAHAVEFRVSQSAQRTIHDIREINMDRRIIVRAALYIICGSLMALLWLLLGSQVALLCEPAAVAFIKHGGEIATYKLQLYWHMRMAFGIVGFLLGLVVGEGVFILLRPLIRPR